MQASMCQSAAAKLLTARPQATLPHTGWAAAAIADVSYSAINSAIVAAGGDKITGYFNQTAQLCVNVM